MSNKPIFLATHPRACSTAFERVFMTRRDILKCAHEPFGDSYYYGPERYGERYANDEAARESSGFSKTTYRDVLDRLEKDGSEQDMQKSGSNQDVVVFYGHATKKIPLICRVRLNCHQKAITNLYPCRSQVRKCIEYLLPMLQGKRVFIKDMAYYLMPPNSEPASIAPSLRKGDSYVEKGNPTVIPLDILKRFHWTFLIRHPRRAIPSYFRCCVPPLDEVTGFKEFLPSEAGYVELRRLFDYLREQGIVGPTLAKDSDKKKPGETTITVIDADDLLDHPEAVVKAFCRETGIEFKPEMLTWDDGENQKHVSDAFAKWNGFHNDAIHSKGLTARTEAHKNVTEESENEEWRQKFGEEAQKVIRACVNENIPHYEYLKSFALEF